MEKVRKAVFPVAGLGTRFLPATKASPKEMLTVVDKPLIQYAVEEAIKAGITEMIFVTSWHKRAIEDHFDKNFELEFKLKQKNKLDLLKQVQNIIPKHINCVYLRQQEALGLGHAVLCAKPLIGDEPFAVILADDLITSNKQTCLEQMVDQYHYQKCGVIAVQEISKEDSNQYGIVSITGERTIKNIIEKPEPKDSPSNLAVVGRYILTPDIFSYIEQVKPGAGGEIQLTDAISDLIKKQRMVVHEFNGSRFDCGDKFGFLVANFECAKQHKELGKRFSDYVTNTFSNQEK